MSYVLPQVQVFQEFRQLQRLREIFRQLETFKLKPPASAAPPDPSLCPLAPGVVLGPDGGIRLLQPGGGSRLFFSPGPEADNARARSPEWSGFLVPAVTQLRKTLPPTSPMVPTCDKVLAALQASPR